MYYQWLPKIHKEDIPCRLIISTRGTVTCEVAKTFIRILGPFIGKSPNHIKNTKDFAEQVKNIKLDKVECIT